MDKGKNGSIAKKSKLIIEIGKGISEVRNVFKIDKGDNVKTISKINKSIESNLFI